MNAQLISINMRCVLSKIIFCFGLLGIFTLELAAPAEGFVLPQLTVEALNRKEGDSTSKKLFDDIQAKIKAQGDAQHGQNVDTLAGEIDEEIKILKPNPPAVNANHQALLTAVNTVQTDIKTALDIYNASIKDVNAANALRQAVTTAQNAFDGAVQGVQLQANGEDRVFGNLKQKALDLNQSLVGLQGNLGNAGSLIGKARLKGLDGFITREGRKAFDDEDEVINQRKSFIKEPGDYAYRAQELAMRVFMSGNDFKEFAARAKKAVEDERDKVLANDDEVRARGLVEAKKDLEQKKAALKPNDPKFAQKNAEIEQLAKDIEEQNDRIRVFGRDAISGEYTKKSAVFDGDEAAIKAAIYREGPKSGLLATLVKANAVRPVDVMKKVAEEAQTFMARVLVAKLPPKPGASEYKSLSLDLKKQADEFYGSQKPDDVEEAWKKHADLRKSIEDAVNQLSGGDDEKKAAAREQVFDYMSNVKEDPQNPGTYIYQGAAKELKLGQALLKSLQTQGGVLITDAQRVMGDKLMLYGGVESLARAIGETPTNDDDASKLVGEKAQLRIQEMLSPNGREVFDPKDTRKTKVPMASLVPVSGGTWTKAVKSVQDTYKAPGEEDSKAPRKNVGRKIAPASTTSSAVQSTAPTSALSQEEAAVADDALNKALRLMGVAVEEQPKKEEKPAAVADVVAVTPKKTGESSANEEPQTPRKLTAASGEESDQPDSPKKVPQVPPLSLSSGQDSSPRLLGSPRLIAANQFSGNSGADAITRKMNMQIQALLEIRNKLADKGAEYWSKNPKEKAALDLALGLHLAGVIKIAQDTGEKNPFKKINTYSSGIDDDDQRKAVAAAFGTLLSNAVNNPEGGGAKKYLKTAQAQKDSGLEPEVSEDGKPAIVSTKFTFKTTLDEKVKKLQLDRTDPKIRGGSPRGTPRTMSPKQLSPRPVSPGSTVAVMSHPAPVSGDHAALQAKLKKAQAKLKALEEPQMPDKAWKQSDPKKYYKLKAEALQRKLATK